MKYLDMDKVDNVLKTAENSTLLRNINIFSLLGVAGSYLALWLIVGVPLNLGLFGASVFLCFLNLVFHFLKE